MTKRALLGLASLMAMAIAASVPAAAKVKINLVIGIPDFGPVINDRISCTQGKKLVHHNGYNNVVARDCGGRTYRYTGWRGKKRYMVYVNSYTADIINVDRF